MASITDFNYTTTKTYDDLTLLDETDLDTTNNAFQSYINARKNDLVRLANDCHGTSYVLDGTAVVSTYTNSLFEKQQSTVSYNGGDISIGTGADVAYAAVDAVNAAITFTPERAGRYRAVFMFTHLFVLNATSEGQCETSFRITDATTASMSVRSGGYAPAPAANSIRRAIPIVITHIFNWADTNPRTITLQKFNRLATNVNSNVVAATAATGEFYALIEKI